ncbi:Teichoic acids export ATP-binding protein TagH [Vibrio aerogenes CECT 7868]|uniref:Teichoic acids export ATP-binding protein TagH n=1 Tax=Vibrio aerogenes CECT 7868 TaxID=1216006 RepID=A0A1M5ZCC8_9VIBR|nr:ABC transporter ATP-binding protein [Vibrio aerogenes]SHI21876.1 Teichoic acids export ATP-binding protein TagH [Vibrio aerogenes CECT 7868]
MIIVEQINKSFSLAASPWQRLRDAIWPHKSGPRFHALQNINFSARPGETLGIVGHNGSGKSTLLQIISGVLTPDSGQVQVQGRIAALLELGSGFNPEFTGRQNVYFNAQLLGLTHQQVEAQFDAILAFADIGDFIDQPVKSYSSGMMLRLAFSVVMHIDPDILIVDEALAVGDDAFQRKCHAKLKQLQARGVTLLFVSHSAGQVIELCDRAILLDHGELLMEGTPKDVVQQYHKLLHLHGSERDEYRSLIQSGQAKSEVTKTKQEDETQLPSGTYDPSLQPASSVWYQNQGAEISDPHIENLCQERVNLLTAGDVYEYVYRISFHREAFEVGAGMMIKTVSGFELAGGTSIRDHQLRIPYVAAGQEVEMRFKFTCQLPNGSYFLNCGCSALVEGERQFLHRGVDAAMFTVVEQSTHMTGAVDMIQTISSEIIHETS